MNKFFDYDAGSGDLPLDDIYKSKNEMSESMNKSSRDKQPTRRRPSLSKTKELREKSVDWISTQFESEKGYRTLLEMSNQFKMISFMLNSNFASLKTMSMSNDKIAQLLESFEDKKLGRLFEEITDRDTVVGKEEATEFAKLFKELTIALPALSEVGDLKYSFKDYAKEIRAMVEDKEMTPDRIESIVKGFVDNLKAIDTTDVELQTIGDNLIKGLEKISMQDRTALSEQFDKLAEKSIQPDIQTFKSLDEISKKLSIGLETDKTFNNKYGIFLEKFKEKPEKFSTGAMKKVDNALSVIEDVIQILVVATPFIIAFFNNIVTYVKDAFPKLMVYIGEKFNKVSDEIVRFFKTLINDFIKGVGDSFNKLFPFLSDKNKLNNKQTEEWKNVVGHGGKITGASRGYIEDLNRHKELEKVKVENQSINKDKSLLLEKITNQDSTSLFKEHLKYTELQAQNKMTVIPVPINMSQEKSDATPIIAGSRTTIDDLNISIVNRRG
jgi:hypothetical protein